MSGGSTAILRKPAAAKAPQEVIDLGSSSDEEGVSAQEAALDMVETQYGDDGVQGDDDDCKILTEEEILAAQGDNFQTLFYL